MKSKIVFNELNYSYSENKILENVSMDIKEDSIVSIIGKSGCGKSTLLNIISGIEKKKGQSKVSFGNVAYSFQEDRLLENLTVYENIKFANKGKSEREILDYIELVMLKGYENYYPKELSGGMRKRVSLARAFINDADILLLDEPFSSLDVSLIGDIVNAIIEIYKRRKRTIIIVTHRVDVAVLISDMIILLGGKPAKLSAEIVIDADRNMRDMKDKKILELIEKIELELGEK